MKITIDNPHLVYSPPVNSQTSKWGVYAIPKMWRTPDGELVVRFNGEADSGLCEQCVPNLYFVSRDDGESWEPVENGDEIYDIKYLTGINPPFIKRKNGEIVGIRYKDGLLPIAGIPYEKEYKVPCGASIVHTYRYGDIPPECIGLELFRKKDGKESVEEITLDFPEREIPVNAKGSASDGNTYVDIPEYVQSNIFASPYFTGLVEFSNGTLAAVAHGQTPCVYDRQCEDAYLVVSEDDGKTWHCRSTIASMPEMPFGCCGDGGEMSLAVTSNGNLICALRTDMSIEGLPCETLICISRDNGYTWSAPKKAADSSVTPHVVALSGGIVLLIYGRPGVHFKISEDNGETWSSSFPIIGKTLSEELSEGKSYMDAKYFDTCSYSNTFVEKLSDNSVLVLYNNTKYDEGDGKHHKAAFVRKITVEV